MSSPFHLPRAREAHLPTDKLVGYALDPMHPRGRHKARVFAAALGIRQTDWRYLHDQILEAIVDAEVRGTRVTQRVATIWMVAGDRPPRLVSTWVDIP